MSDGRFYRLDGEEKEGSIGGMVALACALLKARQEPGFAYTSSIIIAPQMVAELALLGFAVVPCEPSEDMVERGAKVLRDANESAVAGLQAPDVYRAMIEAAP